MEPQVFKDKKHHLKKILILSAYLGLAGLALFLYALQNVNALMDDPDQSYRLTLPSILGWFYDRLSPMATNSLMLGTGSLMITFALYKLLTYRRDVKKLTRAAKEATNYSYHVIIDED